MLKTLLLKHSCKAGTRVIILMFATTVLHLLGGKGQQAQDFFVIQSALDISGILLNMS